MIRQKHYAWVTTLCLNCREEYNRDVTEVGPQLCEQCIDMFSCCKCQKMAPEVTIIFNKETETPWCEDCAEKK